MIKLGDRVRDMITGFEGIATARCIHKYGCDQYDVKPQVSEENNYQDGRWLDEGRLRVIEEGVVKPCQVTVNKPGGPSRGPVRN